MSVDTMTPNVSLDEANLAAERAVLGASLQSPAAFERCAAIVTGDSFQLPAHEIIWDAISYLNSLGTAGERVHADVTLVMGRLHQTGDLAGIGGGPYLHRLYAEPVTPANAPVYARQVEDAAKNRRMTMLGTRIQQAGQSALGADDRDSVISQAMTELEDLNATSGREDPTALIAGALNETLEALEGEGKRGVTTGLFELDEILGGLSGGQVIVIGARPGTGKTLVAQAIASHVARDLNRPALMFSLEMGRMEILTRLLAAECKVNSRHLNFAKPALTDEDWQRLAEGMDKVLSMPLHVNDEESMTPARLNALIGAFKRKHPDLGVVTVDYLTLMNSDSKADNRQQEVSQISREIKKIAKRHDVPIVLLSQLNRGSSDRSDNRPKQTDLRESGAIEQDADVVILLHREDQYEPESPRAGEIDLMVTKHRGGATGTAVAICQLHYYRLTSTQETAKHQHRDSDTPF